MNIVEIAGHLGADPEVRFTASGQKVTTFRVATNIRRQGKDETIWWRVTIFGDRFDKMINYLKKGSGIIVVGEMNSPHIWTDKEGKQQVQLEIVAEMLRFSPFGKTDRSGQEGGASYGQTTSSYGQAPRSQPMQEPSFSEPSYGGSLSPNYSAPSRPEEGYSPFPPANHEEEHIPF